MHCISDKMITGPDTGEVEVLDVDHRGERLLITHPSHTHPRIMSSFRIDPE